MDLHLSGKTAVVTGASKGIGLAITRALVTSCAVIAALIDQPTTRRENRSMTTAT